MEDLILLPRFMVIPLAAVTLLAFVCSLKQGIILPLYVIKAQPTLMVSDMLEFTLKKRRFYGCFSLESATFVAVMTKVIANEVKV